MEIANVIEVINGVVSEPKSFVIQQGNNDPNRTEIVLRAEKYFIDCAKENGIEEGEEEEALDSGIYSNNSGYEVILSWSTIM